MTKTRSTQGPFPWPKICRTADDDHRWHPGSPSDGSGLSMETGAYLISTRPGLDPGRARLIRRTALLNNVGFWNRESEDLQPPIMFGGDGHNYLRFRLPDQYGSYQVMDMGQCDDCAESACSDMVSEPVSLPIGIIDRIASETARGGRILKIGKATGITGKKRKGINQRIHGYKRMQYAITRFALACGSATHADLELRFITTRAANGAISGTGITLTPGGLENDLMACYREAAGFLPPWEQYRRYREVAIPPERAEREYRELLGGILAEAGI